MDLAAEPNTGFVWLQLHAQVSQVPAQTIVSFPCPPPCAPQLVLGGGGTEEASLPWLQAPPSTLFYAAFHICLPAELTVPVCALGLGTTISFVCLIY